MPFRRLTSVLVLALTATPAAAQLRYHRSSTDTLRYQEVTSLRTVVTLPNGEVPVATTHDGTLEIILFPGDSGRGWYTALRLSAQGPTGVLSPDTRVLLRDPFRFRIDDRGRVGKVSTPNFPAPITAITDLTQQFNDFFPRLPAGSVRPGEAWVDTVLTVDSTEKQIGSRRAIVRYVVLRDTATAAGPGVVLSMRQEVEQAGQNRNTIGQLRSTTAGIDSGTVVFSLSGHLLRRERTARLSGTMWISNPSGNHTFPTEVTYTSRIDRLP